MTGRQRGTGLLSNVSANLAVGAAALGYGVIVPAVVVRHFGPDLYGTWYLAFQIAAYVLLLDLGSQLVVTHEAAAVTLESGAARLTTAAMAVQAGLAAAVVVAAAAWAGLTGQGTLAQLVVILGVAAAASLLASTVRAWFGGLSRAHVPAVWLVAARAGSVCGLAVAAAAGLGLVGLTVAVAAPQLVVHAGLLAWARRPPSPWARPDRAAYARLARASLPLVVWTACGVVISGVDIFVVRAVDPSELARYAIALPLLAVPTGAVTAAVTAWMPRVSQANSAGPANGGGLTLLGTTVMTAGLAIGGLAFVGYAGGLVRLLAGPGQWAEAATYLRVLYLATCLRFVFLPWALLVIVRGEQRAIVAAPVVEAAVNLAASIGLGLWLGAVGVALGTLVGAAVAAGVYLTRGLARTSGAGITANALAAAAGRGWAPLVATAGVSALAIAKAPAGGRGLAAVVAVAVDGWWLVVWARTARAVVARPAESLGL